MSEIPRGAYTILELTKCQKAFNDIYDKYIKLKTFVDELAEEDRFSDYKHYCMGLAAKQLIREIEG